MSNRTLHHTRYFSVITILLVLSTFLVNVAQVNAIGDYWAQRKSAPASISLSAGTVVDNKVYVLGGLAAVASASGYQGPVPSNIVYSPGNDSWNILSAMPTVREALGAIAVNGKVYAIGGSGAHGTSNLTEVYDPATNTWTSMRPMPVATTASAMAAVGSTIYVVGGINSTSSTTAVWAFDVIHNEWSRKANMPALLPASGLGFSSQAVAVGGRIYVAPRNTWHESESVHTSLVYDVTGDSWSDSWPGPPFQNISGNNVSVYAYAMTLSATTIFLLGGVDANYHANAVPYNFQYDTVTRIWTRGKDMPTPRTGLVAATVNGLVYAVGGGGSCSAGTSGSCFVNEVYVPPGVQTSLPDKSQNTVGNVWLPVGIIGVVSPIAIGGILFYRRSRRKSRGPSKV